MSRIGIALIPRESWRPFTERQRANAAILKYVRATRDAARPAAAFEWRGGGRARIRANLRPGDLLSVQVAWFPGWKAAVHGEPRPVSADGMAFWSSNRGARAIAKATWHGPAAATSR